MTHFKTKQLLLLKLFAVTSLMLLQGCAALVVVGAAGTAIVSNDRRTTGLFIEDENIELKFVTRLSENDELNQASHINMVSYNGIVLLVGQTPEMKFKQKAGALARRIPNVKQLHNELRISPPSSLSSRSNDSYITSKIKTKMTFEKNFSASSVKVLTENGEVFLMGIVSKHEAKIAIAICKNVDGVKKVIDVFEYIQ